MVNQVPFTRRPDVGVVLMYHRVLKLESDVFGLAVRPETFRAHIAHICDHYTPMPLAEIAHPKRPLPSGAIAITLDDGYADNEVAADILVEHEVPATFFITTRPFRVPGEFWWDRLENLFLGLHALPLEYHSEVGSWPTASPDERMHAFRGIHSALLRATLEERERQLDAVQEWTGLCRRDRDSHRVMNAADVYRLSRRPGVTLGAHTENHVSLPGHPPKVQRLEVTVGRSHLEDIVGQSVEAFSYPFGHWDEVAVSVVRASGFSYAVTTQGGAVGVATDRFRMPRLEVRECEPAALDQQLREAFLGV